MKLATIIKSVAVAIVLSSASLVSTTSSAAITLQCDAGFKLTQDTSTFGSGTFDCRKTVTPPLEIRAGACPFGTINYTAVVGVDFCVDVFGHKRAAVAAAVLDPQNWRVDTDKIGTVQDRFLKGGQPVTVTNNPHVQ